MNTKTAQEGKWLTQATLTDESARTFAKEVAGFGDLDALFTEWSDEQKIEWESQPHPSDEITAEEALEIITGQ